MLQFHGSDRPAAIHRRETLAENLTSRIVRPDTLTDADYKGLSASKRDDYDRKRTLYLSGGIVLKTSGLHQAKILLQQCFAENIGRSSGHAGLMLDGASTLGKTTTARALMSWVFTQYSTRYPEFEKHGRVPVVFIEVPAGSTGKLLMKTFAEFFGMTTKVGESMVSIRNRVVDVINAAGTQLIVVDELHNLATRTAGSGESVDLLKNLHNDLPCTFLYAGIDLTEGSLLGGTRGQQLSSRFTILPLARYNQSTPAEKRRWTQLVTQFEDALPLRHHETGILPALSGYLFERTSGSIGSLSRLITGSAIETIQNGDIEREEITKELLESRRLDHYAESARSLYRGRKNDPMAAANLLKSVSNG